MTHLGNARSIKHLCTLRGRGQLSIAGGARPLATVDYEIDGYLDGAMRTANGQIEGSASALALAFQAGAARLALADGPSLAVVLADPEGGPTAEVTIRDGLPV